MLEQQRCILCGRPFSTGLNVLGCLICFPCEQMLVRPMSGERMTREKRRALLRLYQGREMKNADSGRATNA